MPRSSAFSKEILSPQKPFWCTLKVRLRSESGSLEIFLIVDFASELCRNTAEEDDMDAEDLQNELAPIHVQLGFIKQQLGKSEEAVDIYNSVLKTKYLLSYSYSFLDYLLNSVLALEGLVMTLSAQLLLIMW